MTNSEWPPPNYHYATPAELAEIAEAVSEMDEREFTITSAGYIPRGEWLCDCGEIHNSADCPNAIKEWSGWQA